MTIKNDNAPFSSLQLPFDVMNEKNVDYNIVFTGLSADFCVCIIDIINSTYTSANLYDNSKVRSYYSVFINAVSFIVSRFNGRIIKNAGDSLIFFFPKTHNIHTYEDHNSNNKENILMDIFECGLSILNLRQLINSQYIKLGLNPINYRISAEYGRLEVAKLPFTDAVDLFGPTMNLCAKINNKAPPNSMVIGGDLYCISRQHHHMLSYDNSIHFREIDEYLVRGFKQRYPIYLVETLTSELSSLALAHAISRKLPSIAKELKDYLSSMNHT